MHANFPDFMNTCFLKEMKLSPLVNRLKRPPSLTEGEGHKLHAIASWDESDVSEENATDVLSMRPGTMSKAQLSLTFRITLQKSF